MKLAIFTFAACLLFGGSAWAQDADPDNPLVQTIGGSNKRGPIKNKYVGYLSIPNSGDMQSAEFIIDTNYADLCLDPNVAATTTGNITLEVRRVVSAATANGSFVISFGTLGTTVDGVSDCVVLTQGSYYADITEGGTGVGLMSVTGREH